KKIHSQTMNKNRKHKTRKNSEKLIKPTKNARDRQNRKINQEKTARTGKKHLKKPRLDNPNFNFSRAYRLSTCKMTYFVTADQPYLLTSDSSGAAANCPITFK
ncbi:hypothetical protein OTU49_004068, partial [Cherax quadricarinatus]